MKRFTLVVVAVACFIPIARAKPAKKEEPPKSEWKVFALSVQRFDALAGTYNETKVTAGLQCPGQHIVLIDPKSSKIEVFGDDRQTDFLKAPLKFGKKDHVREAFNSRSKGDRATLEFLAQGAPVPGATKIRIKGAVTVVIGKEEKDVALADLKVGTLTLDKGGKGLGSAISGLFGPQSKYVGSRALKKVVMIGVDGKETPFSITQSFDPNGAGGKGEFSATLRPAPASGMRVEVNLDKIRVTYFDSVERIMVPVDLEVGPGL